MWIFEKTNLLPSKIYLKAMLWANGFLLAVWVSCLLFKKKILSPLAAFILFIAIVICYLMGLYEHPQVNQATKSSVWWLEYPLFVVGFILAATKGSDAVFITFVEFHLWERSFVIEI